jgi:hypothetical protein
MWTCVSRTIVSKSRAAGKSGMQALHPSDGRVAAVCYSEIHRLPTQYSMPSAVKPVAAKRQPQPPRLTWFHLYVWLVCWLFVGAITVKGLREYNQVAGTDKTPGHIALIVLANNLGAFCGPVANPGGTAELAHRFGWPSLAVLLLSLVPFLVVPVPLGRGWHLFVRLLYTLAVVWWFFTAIASLAVSLS